MKNRDSAGRIPTLFDTAVIESVGKNLEFYDPENIQLLQKLSEKRYVLIEKQ